MMMEGNTRYHNLICFQQGNGTMTGPLFSDRLQFLREEEGHFCLPQDWKRLFSTIRLATVSWQEYCPSRWTLRQFQPNQKCPCMSPVLISIICVPFQQSACRCMRFMWVCARRDSAIMTQGVPHALLQTYGTYIVDAGQMRTCPSCSTGLFPLLCVVCFEAIECWGGDTRETYKFSKAHWFVHCGADAVPLTDTTLSVWLFSQLLWNPSFGLLWGCGLYFCNTIEKREPNQEEEEEEDEKRLQFSFFRIFISLFHFYSVPAEWFYWWEWHYLHTTTDGGEGSPLHHNPFQSLNTQSNTQLAGYVATSVCRPS